jgi:CheY-specific phosphatase CheX
MRTIITATEWNNFFWLRVDEDADPTIKELAEAMYFVSEDHKQFTEFLKPGEWHTPYVEHEYIAGTTQLQYLTRDVDGNQVVLSLEDALAISSSCCAQVSYRRLDATKDKALSVYGRLLTGKKVHASPFEHQCTPMKDLTPRVFFNGGNDVEIKCDLEEGVTHIDLKGQGWSGNICGWVQHRQLLANNVKNG